MEVSINPRFKSHIRALKPEERNALEASILNDGCRDSLVVWRDRGILLDGHNRYEICTAHNIEYRIEYKDFEHEEDALDWLIDNQLGRRNLTPDELAYYIGSKYNRAKQSHGGDRKSSPQNGDLKTSERIAQEHNIGKNTVERAGSYAAAVDKIADTLGNEVREKILGQEIKATREEIQELAKDPEKASPIIQKAIAQDMTVSKAIKEIEKQDKLDRIEIIKQELSAKAELFIPDTIEIIHTDCTQWLCSLPSDSIDLIVIDPPYFQVVSNEWDNQWSNLDDYLQWCETWMIESLRVLKPTGSFYIWGGVGERSDAIIHQKLLLDRLGFYFKDWLTWKKARGMGNRQGWLYTREECLWYVKNNELFVWNEDAQYSDEPNQFKVGMGGHPVKSEYKRLTNVWTDIPEPLGAKDTLHYTPKPIEAIKRIIAAHTSPNDLVVDFFGGSGTTGLAAIELGRRAILVDSDLQSVNESKARLQNAKNN